MLRRILQCPASTSAMRVYSSAVAEAEPTAKFSKSAAVFESDRMAVFDQPKLTVPSFEITRKIGNLFAQSFYSVFYERNFSVESLVRGANTGIHSVAHMLAEGQWDKMENIVAKDTVETLKASRKGLSPKVEKALKFSPDDYIISFLHSTIISGKDVLKLSKDRNIGIYFTVVSYVRLSDKVPVDATINQLNGKYKDDVLVCNATKIVMTKQMEIDNVMSNLEKLIKN